MNIDPKKAIVKITYDGRSGLYDSDYLEKSKEGSIYVSNEWGLDKGNNRMVECSVFGPKTDNLIYQGISNRSSVLNLDRFKTTEHTKTLVDVDDLVAICYNKKPVYWIGVEASYVDYDTYVVLSMDDINKTEIWSKNGRKVMSVYIDETYVYIINFMESKLMVYTREMNRFNPKLDIDINIDRDGKNRIPDSLCYKILQYTDMHDTRAFYSYIDHVPAIQVLNDIDICNYIYDDKFVDLSGTDLSAIKVTKSTYKTPIVKLYGGFAVGDFTIHDVVVMNNKNNEITHFERYIFGEE